MSDDDIKAGKYELVALQWDERTSELDKPFTFKRHRQGDTVTLNEEDARRLMLAGAVVRAGDRQKAAVAAAKAQLAAAMALLTPEMREELGVDLSPTDPQPSTAPGANDADAAPDGAEPAGSGATRPATARTSAKA